MRPLRFAKVSISAGSKQPSLANLRGFLRNLSRPAANSQSPYQECWTLALSILRNSGPRPHPPALLHCHPAAIPGTNLSPCSEGHIQRGPANKRRRAYSRITGYTSFQRLHAVACHELPEYGHRRGSARFHPRPEALRLQI